MSYEIRFNCNSIQLEVRFYPRTQGGACNKAGNDLFKSYLQIETLDMKKTVRFHLMTTFDQAYQGIRQIGKVVVIGQQQKEGR